MMSVPKACWCAVLAGVVAGSLLLVVMASSAQAAKTAPVADVVKARRFELVDSKGKVRIFMSTTKGKYGKAYLQVYDAKGKSRIRLQVSDDGETVAVSVHGKSALLMAQGDGRRAGASLGVSQISGGYLRLEDVAGTKKKTITP